MVDQAQRQHFARALWTLFEPLHAVTYFSTEARNAFAAIGLPRYWDGYFAGRAAPLGAVVAAPVSAIFSGFSPALVNRALPSVWSVAPVEAVLEARLAGAASTLRALYSDGVAVAAAADALMAVALRVNTIGRPLAAANLAQNVGGDPFRRLWQAATILREHRGEGHVMALVSGDIAGISTLVLRSAVDLEGPRMQSSRGWTDEEWAASHASLISRGLLAVDGSITALGTEALTTAEHLTNRLAVLGIDEGEIGNLAALLTPITAAVVTLFPYPNPIGMPRPWQPAGDPAAAAVPTAPGVLVP
jgi:hypothetical protein